MENINEQLEEKYKQIKEKRSKLYKDIAEAEKIYKHITEMPGYDDYTEIHEKMRKIDNRIKVMKLALKYIESEMKFPEYDGDDV
jgi:hypothetical protein